MRKYRKEKKKNNHSGDNCVISIDPASLGSVGGWNAFSDIVYRAFAFACFLLVRILSVKIFFSFGKQFEKKFVKIGEE